MALSLFQHVAGTTSAALTNVAVYDVVVVVSINAAASNNPNPPTFATGTNTFGTSINQSVSTVGTSGSAIRVWYSKVASAFTGNITAGGNTTNMYVYVFRGFTSGGVLDVTTSSFGSSSIPTASITTTGTGDLLFSALPGQGTNTAGSGFALVNASTLINGVFFADEWKAQTSPGAVGLPFGTTTATWTEIAFAIKPIVQAATPIFSPVGGSYSAYQSVTISCSTPSSSIYYTLDSSTPTPSSTLYTGAISVSVSETIQAVATATGYGTSAVGTATYVVPATTPTFSPVAGSYSSAQNVVVSTTTPSALLHITTDGSAPTGASPTYSSPKTLPVSVSQTINAYATATGFNDSAVGSAAYTITVYAATPTFDIPSGTYTSIQVVNISTTSAGASIYYTLDGSTPTTSSTLYVPPGSAPVNVATSETINAIASGGGFGTSGVGTVSYVINLPAASTPTFNPVGGTYLPQMVTISCTTPGSAIYYTTDGSTPTISSTPYTGGVLVTVTSTLRAIAASYDYSNSAVGSAAYIIFDFKPHQLTLTACGC